MPAAWRALSLQELEQLWAGLGAAAIRGITAGDRRASLQLCVPLAQTTAPTAGGGSPWLLLLFEMRIWQYGNKGDTNFLCFSLLLLVHIIMLLEALAIASILIT